MKSAVALWTEQRETFAARRLLAVGGFALATGLAAAVRIPIPGSPVPITLQTMVVLSAGLWLGVRWAALSQILYLLAGALGMAWFAGGHNSLFLALPTAGYLLAFPLAAALAGRGYRNSLGERTFYTVLADLFILAMGACWLAYFGGLSLGQAVTVGVIPFLPGNAVKVFLAVTLARPAQR